MGLKNVNYKQFFLDHGERIGVAIAGVITLLLLLMLLMSGIGYMNHPAGANAEELGKATEAVEQGIQKNKPDQPGETPGDPSDKLVAFNFTIIGPETAKGYEVADLFDPLKAGQMGRRMPTLYQPIESAVGLARIQLPTLEFNSDLDRVGILKGVTPAATAGGAMPGGSAMPSAAGVKGMFSGPGKTGFDPRAALMGKGAGDVRSKLLHDKNAPAEEGEEHPIEFVSVSTLDKSGAVTFAEQAYPKRIGEVAAAFPYKAQVEEFRSKLRLPSDAAVLSELSLEVGKDGRPLNGFRFLGVNIQRREVSAPGKPAGDKAQGTWAALDLDGSYKPLVILDGKRFEDEDPRLRSVIFPGMVMKKLLTLGARRTPPLDEYPKVEDDLPTLKTTLDALEKKPDAVIAKPALTNDPGSVFEDQPAAPAGPNGMMPPGGSLPPGGSTPPSFTPPGGSSMPLSPGGFQSPYAPDGLKPGQELAVPDVCLIRLFDVNVEPGKTYEYRMQVRMANPNFGRADTASQGYKDATELPATDWYVLPQKLTVPNDVYYYAVDQKELDAKEPKPAAEKGAEKELKLPTPPLGPNQTVVQIHRWIDYLHPKNRLDVPVGDWVIAERAVATRGEPIGSQRVEVPYWRTTADRFAMYSDVPPKMSNRIPPSVEAPFVPEGEVPIVVDFRAGDLTYRRTHPRTDDAAAPADQPPAVQDKQPLEVLLCTPDGKLLAHDATKDVPDPDRVKRVKDARDWIQQVKTGASKGGSDANNPFGPKP